MRFTRSKDGRMRATLVVRQRVDFGMVAVAIALEVYGADDPAARAADLSAREIEEALRWRLAADGDGIHWTEHDDADPDWKAALAAAEARVEELWGGDDGEG